MSFFNKKEDVIDIQLTQYGKLLLSRGRFKPEYYCFFDDDILYDSNYAGVNESQNSAEGRIKETPYNRPQHAFYGVETKYSQMNIDIREGEAELYEVFTATPDNEERENALRYPLCHGVLGSQETPHVTISALSAPFTGSLSYYSGSNVSLPIPQLNCESTYTILRTHTSVDEALLTEDVMQEELVFENGVTYRLIPGSTPSFEFIEENSPFTSENLEVEIFEVVSGSASADEVILLPLYFANCKNPLSDLGNYFEIGIDETSSGIAQRGLFVPRSVSSISSAALSAIRENNGLYSVGMPVIGDECE